MNILLLSEYFPDSEKAEITGGVESRAFNVAKRLAKKHKVKIITSWQKGLKRYDMFCNFEVYRVGPNHRYSHYAGYISRLKFAKAAVKLGKKLKDVEIVDGYNFTTYYPANRIAKKLKKPCIATYHETWVGEWLKNNGIITGIPYEIFERLILKLRFDKYISVSNFTKKRLAKRGIKKEKIIVIPNGVDLKEFEKIKAKKFSKPTICCINRLTKNKRVDDIIKALGIVRVKFPDIKCKIVGKGPEMNNLKKLAKGLKLEKNIEFLGFVEKHDDVFRILKASHLFCSASLVEGFGMVVIEAMASNVPYVCSNIEPFKEVTENGKGGLIFKAENYKDLADNMIELLKNKKLYDRKKKEGKELVRKYDWDIIVKKIEKVYSKKK